MQREQKIFYKPLPKWQFKIESEKARLPITSLGEEKSSHLFWKLLADVGKPLNCSQQGFCRDFLWFFFPPLFPTTCVCLASARLTCGLPRWSCCQVLHTLLRSKTTEAEGYRATLGMGARTVTENLLPEYSFQLPFLRPREPERQPISKVLAFPAAAICNLILDFFFFNCSSGDLSS